MDFSFSEDQQAISDLAKQIFTDKSTPDRCRAIEQTDDCFDEELWGDLASAGLLGVAIPEALGGSGFGFTELSLLLEQQGGCTALVPLYANLVLAAAPLLEFGSEEQQQQYLPGIARGEHKVTGAYLEAGALPGDRPTCQAVKDGESWLLSGEKICVQAAHISQYVLVSAATSEDGFGVFIVDLAAEGVSVQKQRGTTREVESTLTLAKVAVDGSQLLGNATGGATILQWIQDRGAIALAALQLGVSRQALTITAQYVTEREQFGRPIGSFQAIAQRAADCYIDVQAMESTLWEAAWLESQGLPCSEEAAITKWWACCAGQRIAYTGQHLHGGMGADIDYPIHRYFIWSKKLELELGGAAQQLAAIGDKMAG